MSSPPPVELFKGTNWEECHKFILAIRTRALWEGKQRDSAWMADFAATCFWHKALPWHSRLPEDVRQDWSKLEIALFDRWPLLEDEDDSRVKPIAAAAPSLNLNIKSDPPLQGVLKLVLGDSNPSYYLKPPGPVCDLTSDRNEALRVRCNSSPSGTLLEQIDHQYHSWLAVQWSLCEPVVDKGSYHHARVTSMDSETMKSSWSTKSPLQRITCTILANGEVIPVWKKDDTSQITLFPFVAGTSYLYLTADAEAYAQHYDEKRAKLFIEATD
ncbi:hypothetical protein M407DRAFT_33374 [Tulasnella calospora MUT 4182]|uniref:Uncharacterized protein n=1 Tax=Tulasnella calospora MUT 4182 TaxID=1051891 RepID=A0A0C3K6H9_9AGAM|nr:hypothetical protein M407DRAFT_33374 [Tulasnella calospora MUT 4182]